MKLRAMILALCLAGCTTVVPTTGTAIKGAYELYDPEAEAAAQATTCEQGFKAKDANKDGKLTFEEYTAKKWVVLTSPTQDPHIPFTRDDKDKDGRLTVAEHCASYYAAGAHPFPAKTQKEQEPNNDAAHANKLAPDVSFEGAVVPDEVDFITLDLPGGAGGQIYLRYIKTLNGMNQASRLGEDGNDPSLFDKGSWTVEPGAKPVLRIKGTAEGNPDRKALPYKIAYTFTPAASPSPSASPDQAATPAQ